MKRWLAVLGVLLAGALLLPQHAWSQGAIVNNGLQLQGSPLSIKFYDGTNTGTLQPATLTGNRTWTLPDASGTILLSSTIGTTAWVLGGNTLTSVQRLGTVSSHDLPIITNDVERMRITAAGDVVVQNQASTGATKVIIRAGANQATVNLLEWQNNGGLPLGFIRPDGSVVVVYDPLTATARQAFFGVAKPSGALLIGIGPDVASGGWGVGVYDDATGQLRAGMGKDGVSGEWRMGVGRLADQNGVLLSWKTSTTDNEPRIVVANGSLANPVFLVDREGDVTASGNIAITNTDGTARELRLYEPSGAGTNYTAFRAQAQASDITYTLPASLTPTSTVAAGILQTDGSGNLSWLTPSALVSGGAWALTGNSITGTEFLGTTNAQPLVIRTNNTERLRITATGDVGIGTASPTERLQVSDGNIAITNTDGTARELRLYEPSGAGTNYTAFRAQAQASDITYTLPASLTPTSTVAAGILQTDGSGNLSWLTPSALVSGGAWALTGNSITGTEFLGTTNAQPLVIRTNNTERMRITATGDVVVQNQAAGTPTTVLRVLGGDNGAGATQVIIQAGVNQAVAGVNLLQWQNNGGAPLGVIRPEGSVVLVYDPPARQAFFAVANPSGVPLIGIGPDPAGWGVGVYEPTGPFGQLRAGMGKVSGEWRVGVGDLAAQNGVLLNWATTGTANEPRIVVANGSLANPVFLVDREGDVTASGNIAITNTDGTARELRLYEPSGAGTNYTAFRAQAQASDIIYTLPASLTPTSTVAAGILQTDASGNLSWLTPSALVSGGAWALTGNSITGTEFLGTTNAQPLVIRTNNTERMRITATGDVVVQNQAAGTPTTVLRVLGGDNGAGATQVIIQAGVNQAVAGVNLLQWQNNGGAPLGVIRPEGSVVLVYDPPARQAFFAVANPSGVPLIGIGPDPTGWGVGVYEPTGPFGQLRAGMGKVSGEWRVGVGDLAAQNGVLLNWATTGTANEPRIVVANGSLANPVFLVDREGDVTASGNIAITNTDGTARELRLYEPSGAGTNYTAFRAQAQASDITYTLPASLTPTSTVAAGILQTDGSGNLSWLTPSALVSGGAWALTGNSITGTEFLGTTNAQPLVIRTDNTERMRVTETGDVGIGTSTPGARLHVVGTGRFDGQLTVTTDGAAITGNSTVTGTLTVSSDVSVGGNGSVTGNLTVDGNTTLGDASGDAVTVNAGTVSLPNIPSGSTATEVLVWNSSGSKVERRAASGLIGAAGGWAVGGNAFGGTNSTQVLGTTTSDNLQIQTGGANAIYFNTNTNAGGDTVEAQLTSTGQLVFFTTGTPGFRVDLPNNSANAVGRIRATGISFWSSMRWKEDIRPIPNALEKALALRGVNFRWKPEYGGGEDMGFIMEEVDRVVPEVVQRDERTGELLGMDYARLTALLVEALKEEHRRNEALRAEVAELRSLVEQLLRQNGERGTSSQPSTIQDAWLGQNIPNPFAGTTTIPYYIPAGVSRAELVVRDVGGRELRRLELAERGAHGQVVLEMGLMGSGTYEYALVLDGRVVAVKQMTLVR